MNCFAFAEALLSFAASQRLEALLVRDGTRATAVGARAELKHARVGAGPEAEALLSFDVFELVILRCSFGRPVSRLKVFTYTFTSAAVQS